MDKKSGVNAENSVHPIFFIIKPKNANIITLYMLRKWKKFTRILADVAPIL